MQTIIRRFAKLDNGSGVSKATRDIGSVASCAGELGADLLDSLRRLDTILTIA